MIDGVADKEQALSCVCDGHGEMAGRMPRRGDDAHAGDNLRAILHQLDAVAQRLQGALADVVCAVKAGLVQRRLGWGG